MKIRECIDPDGIADDAVVIELGRGDDYKITYKKGAPHFIYLHKADFYKAMREQYGDNFLEPI
jgi:hypothetical protein